MIKPRRDYRCSRFDEISSEFESHNVVQSGGFLHVLPAERDAVRRRDLGRSLVLQGTGRERRRAQADIRTIRARSLGPGRQIRKEHRHGNLRDRHQRWVNGGWNPSLSLPRSPSSNPHPYVRHIRIRIV